MAENNDLFQLDNSSGVEESTQKQTYRQKRSRHLSQRMTPLITKNPTTQSGSYNDDAIQHLD